jgi:hypothetical protein
MANFPVHSPASPDSTGTTPEQRWEVLRDYRWYRQRGNDSAEALRCTRAGLANARRSARNYAARLYASARPARAAAHAEVADYYAASLHYLDTVLQPRVDAWNSPREPDMLDALSRSLGGIPVQVSDKIPADEVHVKSANRTMIIKVEP